MSSTHTSKQSEPLDAAIKEEQVFLNEAYSTVADLRKQYRQRQQEIEAQGAWGSPQARTERDAKAAHYGDQATRLEQIEDRLVFGRLDTEEGAKNYIGRVGLANDEGGRLLLDWRVPAARPFYQATAAHPQGIVRRRHISTHLRKVTGLEDDVLNIESARDSGLQFQGEGALMSALATARDGRMSDIVATIQAEQDQIIRASDEGILVVQGGPGTGKTAVALHRAAYLLYTHRERLERSGVLLVGPSQIFLRYIEKVLPSLGEDGVVAITPGQLVPGFNPTKEDSAKVAYAKGKLAWVETLKAAVKDLQRLPPEDLTFHVNGKKVRLTRDDVLRARTNARRGGKTHNEARTNFALELIGVLTEQLGEDEDAESLSWWEDAVRSHRDIRREINLCWMPTSATDLLAKLFSRPELLARVNRGLEPTDLKLVQRPPQSSLTVSDIPLLDELEELLGPLQDSAATQASQKAQDRAIRIEHIQDAMASQELGGGIVSAELLDAHTQQNSEWIPLAERALKDRTWTYGHIVVDEAQDLSPMDWHALLRRCPSRSFTVVGDLDQYRGHQRPTSWFAALGPASRALQDEFVLTISYRTPETLTRLAQDVLREAGHPVLYPITSARDRPDCLADTQLSADDLTHRGLEKIIQTELSILDGLVGKDEGKIGVLLSSGRAEEWGADTTGAKALDERVSFLSVAGAKGLEFDTTILVEPAEILADGPGDLFVAMTRSTQRLHSVRNGPLPLVWESTLEKETQL